MDARFWGDLHPSSDILGTEESDIRDKCIALGVTGGASIYRSIDLARKLMRMGAQVRVIMTDAAAKLVSPMLFEWATGYPAVVEPGGEVSHIALATHCDAVVVAPATLNTMGELASFLANDAVTLTAHEALGRGKPVLIVPAMHEGMWRRSHRLVESLEKQGFKVMKPVIEEGKAKYPPIELVAWWIEAMITRGTDFRDIRVLVTAGPTIEYIDPVRIITNPSTGMMGVSIALEAYFRGATVTLIHGPLRTCITYYGVKDIGINTTEEMYEAVMSELGQGYDMAFYAAAVADYKPKHSIASKIPSHETPTLVVELERTPKIVREAAASHPEVFHVGFAAETVNSIDELEAKAREKIERYGVDLIAANIVGRPGRGFGTGTNELLVIDKTGRRWYIPLMPKRMVARRLLSIALEVRAEQLKSPST